MVDGDIYVDTQGYYSYILLDGDDEWIESVKATLIGLKLIISRGGPSTRPAANGIQYRWYLRLENTVEPIDVEEIYSAFGGYEDVNPGPYNPIFCECGEPRELLFRFKKCLERKYSTRQIGRASAPQGRGGVRPSIFSGAPVNERRQSNPVGSERLSLAAWATML